MIDNLLNLADEEGLNLEIAIDEEQNTAIETFNDQVNQYEISNVTIYKLKGVYNDKVVRLTTEDISNPKLLIDELINNSRIIDNMDETTFAKNIDIENDYSPNVDDDYNVIINDLLNLNSYRSSFPNLNVVNIYYTHRYNKRSIINKNVELVDSSVATYIYGELVWSENGINQTGVFSVVDKRYDNNRLKSKVIETIEDMRQKINSASCKSGKYNIILKSQQVFQILKAFISMFDAEKIDNKLSPLNDEYNNKIFANNLTIVEDPLNKKLIGRRLFDEEGNKTYYKEIIKDGKFITKLYDNRMAMKENTMPTGTSGGVRNFYILPGDKSFDELVHDLNNGIIIDDLAGLHAGANTLNGDLSLQADGYKVENGKITNALKSIIFQTNIKELLNNVVEIGNDLEFYSEIGGSPSILCKNIMIVGKE
ncbi:MAG: TldD/PmbA family protein [Bacilli bacterium]|nr:TldD/PmbA family protein [Bacilli bacterium]